MSNDELKPTKISNHATEQVKRDMTSAIEAADFIHSQGGSPRKQLEAARVAMGKNLTYAPHQSMKERERNLRRLKAKEE